MTSEGSFDCNFEAEQTRNRFSRQVVVISGIENNISPDLESGDQKAHNFSHTGRIPTLDAEVRARLSSTAAPRVSLSGRRSSSAIPQRTSLGADSRSGQVAAASLTGSARTADDCFSASSKGARGSCFDPQTFVGILKDGVPNSPMHVVNERELSRQIAKVAGGLANSEDWNARIVALQLLQSLSLGNLSDFECCGGLVRGLQESVSAIS